MTIREISAIDLHSEVLADALDECNDAVNRFGLSESDVISVNVLPPDPKAVADGVKVGKPPRVRVVMTFWRYVPLG
jgi:hypothetical protein